MPLPRFRESWVVHGLTFDMSVEEESNFRKAQNLDRFVAVRFCASDFFRRFSIFLERVVRYMVRLTPQIESSGNMAKAAEVTSRDMTQTEAQVHSFQKSPLYFSLSLGMVSRRGYNFIPIPEQDDSTLKSRTHLPLYLFLELANVLF